MQPVKCGAAMKHSTQAKCPYCLSSEGYVRAVTLTADGRVFTFVCADCDGTWKGEPHVYEGVDLQPAQPSNLYLVRSKRMVNARR